MKKPEIDIPAVFSAESGFTQRSLGYDQAGLNRLNARHAMFMAPVRAEFEGASVLDLGSHNGRWSWAALELGAKHVTGIEARGALIKDGEHLFNGKYRNAANFIEGDIFDVLPQMVREGRQFDIVLCLGIFYHIMDHYSLLKHIRQLRPHMVILDTGLIVSERSFIDLELEPTGNILNTIGRSEGARKNVVGLVSVGGLKMICKALGFTLEFREWTKYDFKDRGKLDDYINPVPGQKQRYSAVLSPK